jgi:ribonuclease HII
VREADAGLPGVEGVDNDVAMPWWRHPGYTPRRAAGLTGYERVLARAGLSPVAGIDEAGRGACAGPLVVAAVILDPRKLSGLSGVADSKTLTAAAREEAYAEVMRTALSWHRVIIPAAEIDACGLHVCNIAGMRRALAGLSVRPGYALTDGFAVRGLGVPALAMWKGDEVAACVAAASIVAKVTRDGIMTGLSEQYPAYGFARHKGYSTRSHMRALAQHGPCPEHRASFANVNGLVRDLPVVGEEPVLDEEPIAGQEPMADQEGYEQEVAGPEMAGQAGAQVGAGREVDGQLRSREMLGGELAYR